jgi:photosystem II stability/assembly factor-like uncharacterized protein
VFAGGGPAVVRSRYVVADLAGRHPGSDSWDIADGVHQVEFSSRRVGWIYGGGLYSTRDGGRSWKRVGLQGTVTDLDTVGHETWVIDAACNTAGGMCQTGRVLRAQAGSLRFRPVATLPRFGSPGGSFGASMVTHDGAVYLLAYSNFHPRLLVSLDRGGHWRTRRLPCTNATSIHVTLALWSAVGVVAVCAGEPGAGSQEQRVYVSDDAAAHWSYRGSVPLPGYNTAVAAPSASTWYIADIHAAPGLDATTDAGRHWQAISGPDLPMGFSSIAFSDPLHGAAVPESPLAGVIWETDRSPSGWHRWAVTGHL